MKTIVKTIVLSSFMAASLLFISCQKDMNSGNNVQYASLLSVSGDGTTSVITVNVKSAFVQKSGLSESELASLLKMKEEENWHVMFIRFFISNGEVRFFRTYQQQRVIT